MATVTDYRLTSKNLVDSITFFNSAAMAAKIVVINTKKMKVIHVNRH